MLNNLPKEFKKPNYWFFIPEQYKYLIVYRWLNINCFPVDIQNWEGLYDYAITNPYKNEVIMDNVTSKSRTKDFDTILKRAVVKALYLKNKWRFTVTDNNNPYK